MQQENQLVLLKLKIIKEIDQMLKFNLLKDKITRENLLKKLRSVIVVINLKT